MKGDFGNDKKGERGSCPVPHPSDLTPTLSIKDGEGVLAQA